MMPAIYGNSYRIVQAPGWVAISYEMVNETRVIPLGGRKHLGRPFRFYMGDARAHWEGDALVVDTTNFNPKLTFRNGNADTLRLVERFQRVAPKKVRWTVTAEDPQTWSRPWTLSMPLTEDDSQQLYEYACHEGNLSLANILSGARADEKAGKVSVIPTAAEGERGTSLAGGVYTLIQSCTSTAENAEFFPERMFFREFCPPSLAAKTASFGEVTPKFAGTQPRT